MTDIPKPKRGRPRVVKPPKIVQRPKTLDGSIRIAFKLDAATLARLDAICEARRETRSQAIRSLIDLY